MSLGMGSLAGPLEGLQAGDDDEFMITDIPEAPGVDPFGLQVPDGAGIADPGVLFGTHTGAPGIGAQQGAPRAAQQHQANRGQGAGASSSAFGVMGGNDSPSFLRNKMDTGANLDALPAASSFDVRCMDLLGKGSDGAKGSAMGRALSNGPLGRGSGDLGSRRRERSTLPSNFRLTFDPLNPINSPGGMSSPVSLPGESGGEIHPRSHAPAHSPSHLRLCLVMSLHVKGQSTTINCSSFLHPRVSRLQADGAGGGAVTSPGSAAGGAAWRALSPPFQSDVSCPPHAMGAKQGAGASSSAFGVMGGNDSPSFLRNKMDTGANLDALPAASSFDVRCMDLLGKGSDGAKGSAMGRALSNGPLGRGSGDLGSRRRERSTLPSNFRLTFDPLNPINSPGGMSSPVSLP
eukprot:CAMPEP_0172021964 /NCGR_PEP_ID=MMETSP1041-20130122/14005_1 /TAXON_ID=464988 /ORGANISM="Hemiselmis andersenii, Strain CCMP439" /LENGTH=403 /DNA_ID=CAMNT_0012677349 /DNA_START=68 /DNA_END=1276 /DNA_ORIENTATION=-